MRSICDEKERLSCRYFVETFERMCTMWLCKGYECEVADERRSPRFARRHVSKWNRLHRAQWRRRGRRTRVAHSPRSDQRHTQIAHRHRSRQRASRFDFAPRRSHDARCAIANPASSPRWWDPLTSRGIPRCKRRNQDEEEDFCGPHRRRRNSAQTSPHRRNSPRYIDGDRAHERQCPRSHCHQRHPFRFAPRPKPRRRAR